MLDPVSLRNLISSSIYAEQINAAQVSGQEAERQRQVRVRQQAVQEEAQSVAKTLASDKLDVNQDGKNQGEFESEDSKKSDRQGEQNTESEGIIDVTV